MYIVYTFTIQSYLEEFFLSLLKITLTIINCLIFSECRVVVIFPCNPTVCKGLGLENYFSGIRLDLNKAKEKNGVDWKGFYGMYGLS